MERRTFSDDTVPAAAAGCDVTPTVMTSLGQEHTFTYIFRVRRTLDVSPLMCYVLTYLLTFLLKHIHAAA